jgi:hypothetical protein
LLQALTFIGANQVTLLAGTAFAIMIEYSGGDGSNASFRSWTNSIT